MRFDSDPLGFGSVIDVQVEPAKPLQVGAASSSQHDPGKIRRDWVSHPKSPPLSSLTLYVNGIDLPGSYLNEKIPIPGDGYQFRFGLTRKTDDPTNVKAWKEILQTFDAWGNGEVRLAIGFRNYLPAPLDPVAQVRVFTRNTTLWFVGAILLAALALVGLTRLTWMRDVGWEPRGRSWNIYC